MHGTGLRFSSAEFPYRGHFCPRQYSPENSGFGCRGQKCPRYEEAPEPVTESNVADTLQPGMFFRGRLCSYIGAISLSTLLKKPLSLSYVGNS